MLIRSNGCLVFKRWTGSRLKKRGLHSLQVKQEDVISKNIFACLFSVHNNKFITS